MWCFHFSFQMFQGWCVRVFQLFPVCVTCVFCFVPQLFVSRLLQLFPVGLYKCSPQISVLKCSRCFKISKVFKIVEYFRRFPKMLLGFRRSLKIVEDICRLVAIFGEFRRPLKTLERLWGSLKIIEDHWSLQTWSMIFADLILKDHF